LRYKIELTLYIMIRAGPRVPFVQNDNPSTASGTVGTRLCNVFFSACGEIESVVLNCER